MESNSRSSRDSIERPFKCQYCPKRYTRAHAVKRHFLQDHSPETTPVSSPDIREALTIEASRSSEENTRGDPTPQIIVQMVPEVRETSVSRQYISIDRRSEELEADLETSQVIINDNGKRPQFGYDRVADARRRQSIPKYEVKQSKKTPGQQRGLAWLTAKGKMEFETHFASILAQWGVKDTHKGTCVLLPEDWKSLDPVLLSNLFAPEKCPLAGSGRFSYKYSDHVTAFARAVAWYQTWPRRAADLDQLLGCTAFKQKDASHTCHQEFCLIHITYEGADINEDRKLCCERAKFLRAEGRPVPEHCTRHNPPCLMQHASLTTLEALNIQFSVLRQARGIQSSESFARPRRHPYSIFESQLPLSSGFTAITLDLDHLHLDTPSSKKNGKPDLICEFCTRIKSFTTIVGYLAHLFHKHGDEDVEKGLSREQCLKEMKRVSLLWLSYWRRYPDRSTYGQSTLKKLEQTREEDFDWEIVERWRLRG